MFNIGPLELVVLAIVGLIVLGPDRLPGLAKDAGRMIRTLRDLANGAQTQLREELGPEFADLDLRSLHPKTMIQQALMGQDEPAAPVAPVAPATPPAARPPVQPPLAADESAPFDEDAT